MTDFERNTAVNASEQVAVAYVEKRVICRDVFTNLKLQGVINGRDVE